MDRWQNKVAVVTGASSGIGEACTRYLLQNGMIVVGMARRKELMDSKRAELDEEQQERYHTLRCDVSQEADIIEAFAWIESELGGVDVLVNNAGVFKTTTLTASDNSSDLRATIDTMVMGAVFCTREAFQSMKRRNVDGHIVLINSLSGHSVPVIPGMNLHLYAAAKHAITAITEVLRQEFIMHKTGIKVTSISPGATDTQIVPGGFPEGYTMLRSEDIADAIVYCLQTPPRVQIHEMIIKPVGEMA